MRRLLVGLMMIALSFGCTKIVTKKEIEYVYINPQVAYVEKLSMPKPDENMFKLLVEDGFIKVTPDQMTKIVTYIEGSNIMITKQREIIDSHNAYLKRLNERDLNAE